MDIIDTVKEIGIPSAVAIGLGFGGWRIIQFILNDMLVKISELKDIVIKLIEKISGLKTELLVMKAEIAEANKHLIKIEKNGNGHSSPPKRKRRV